MFFSDVRPVDARDTLLVAFSGGPDSTALLWGLDRLDGPRVEAAHVDHALDAGSGDRAMRARRTCARLGIPLTLEEHPVPPARIAHRGLEHAARVVRYGALEEIRRRRRARYLVTAHHRDDQVETVLLRLLAGSGWQGLAGIPATRDPIVRPLLRLSRRELARALSGSGLETVDDPTNRDLELRRNRLRRALLPRLEQAEPGVGESCLRVAHAAARARRALDRRLGRRLEPSVQERGASLDLERLERLPPALLPAAAALLHRRAGAAYPPSLAAVGELDRQLRAGRGIGGDCGDGWRWQRRGRRLHLTRVAAPPARFTYTVEVPGEVDLTEVSLRLRLGRSPVDAWMFRGSPTRTALGAALRRGERMTVRNRRPGDRIRPLGCHYSRRLKDVLIDKRIPRAERDRIPLLCIGDEIVWVPGVTIGDRFRLRDEPEAWVAELTPA